MSTTVSPQVRVLALVGVLVAVAIGLTVMTLSRHGSATAEPKVIKPLHPVQKHSISSHTAPRPVTPSVGTKPATLPAVKHAVKPKRLVAANGLPWAIAVALHKHPVVVVALYQPARDATAAQILRAGAGTSAEGAVGVDRFALAEAAAGAKDAHAGFVGVNVLSQREAKPLAAVLGILEDPTVLVFTRPAQLSVKLVGYADRTSVAQAAANARP